MHDIIFTLITIGLFGLSVVYVALGERAISRSSEAATNDAKTLTRSA